MTTQPHTFGTQEAGARSAPDPPTVFIVAPTDLSAELGLTVLWRHGVRRVMLSNLDKAAELARLQQPKVVVVGGVAAHAAAAAVRRLRHDPATRDAAIVVVNGSALFEDEQRLRDAGANVVLPPPVDPALWDRRLEQLLNVPPRRSSRIPVRFTAWTRTGADMPQEGLALNVSVRGMLLESRELLEEGRTLDLWLVLPGIKQELRVVGQVVRTEPAPGQRSRAGIQFLVLRGDARRRITAFVEGRRAGAAGRAWEQEEESLAWESELRASEAREVALLDAALDCVVTVDEEGHIREFNRAAEATFGYRRSEVVGRPVAECLVPPALREAHHHGFLGSAVPGSPERSRGLEMTAMRADGTEFPAELAVTPFTFKGRPMFAASIRDVTVRRRTERSAACENAVTRLLAEATSPAGAAPRLLEEIAKAHEWDAGALWITEAGGRALRCAAHWKAEGVLAPELEALDAAVAVPAGTGLSGHALALGQPVWMSDLGEWSRFPRVRAAAGWGMRSGLVVPLLVQGEPVGTIELYGRRSRERDQDTLGRLAVLAAHVGHFLERHRAGLALREREERFRALVENSTDVTAILSSDGNVRYVSPSLLGVLGRPAEQARGRSAFLYVHPDDRHGAREALRRCAREPGRTERATLRFRHEDGSWRNLEVVGVNHLDNPAISGVVANFRDVTERLRAEEEKRQLEEQLRQAQKIEAVGRLAGSVARSPESPPPC